MMKLKFCDIKLWWEGWKTILHGLRPAHVKNGYQKNRRFFRVDILNTNQKNGRFFCIDIFVRHVDIRFRVTSFLQIRQQTISGRLFQVVVPDNTVLEKQWRQILKFTVTIWIPNTWIPDSPEYRIHLNTGLFSVRFSDGWTIWNPVRISNGST